MSSCVMVSFPLILVQPVQHYVAQSLLKRRTRFSGLVADPYQVIQRGSVIDIPDQRQNGLREDAIDERVWFGSTTSKSAGV